MKIIVAIIVYNRYQNIERWLNCWQQCNKENAELVVIHNDNGESEKFKSVCQLANVKYILRKNIGFDIGCMQDVFRERLPGFPEYDYLLWATDDTVPMSKNFIQPFIEKLLSENVGVSCMKISKSVSPHIRTTGFCIKKQIAKQIEFPADPIINKSQCYFYEHRGGNKTFTHQVRKLGFDCVQVTPDAISPLFDMGYWKRLDREAEHERVFNTGKVKGDKVTFICTIFNTYPQIISSLILQTHQNWELILIHDGPNETGLKKLINGDPRIKYIETKERQGNWGHGLRQMALKEMELGDYTTITNADNYYVPVFIEYMLKGFKSHTSVATYCEKMTHSYKAWDVIPCRLERGFLDCGGVMVKSEVAKEVGWKEVEEHSADWVYFSDIASRYSWSNFVPVKGNLFVHN